MKTSSKWRKLRIISYFRGSKQGFGLTGFVESGNQPSLRQSIPLVRIPSILSENFPIALDIGTSGYCAMKWISTQTLSELLSQHQEGKTWYQKVRQCPQLYRRLLSEALGLTQALWKEGRWQRDFGGVQTDHFLALKRELEPDAEFVVPSF